MTTRCQYYHLGGEDGHSPIGVRSFLEWTAAAFVGRDAWRVAKTSVGDVRVSTVFLGLDHNFVDSGPPAIFETMVFGGPLDGDMERYATWEEAEAGHGRMVVRVSRANRLPDRIWRRVTAAARAVLP